MVKKAGAASPNELLMYEREQRHWTQEDVAVRVEAPDAKMVGRWERGITTPTAYYRQKLMTLFGKSARELGFVRNGEIAFWRVPARRNLFFTGREALLEQIHNSLTQHKSTALLPPQALSGLGGIGKSQTALEYAYRYAQNYHTVVWLRADTSETLASDFIMLAHLLKLPERDEQDQQRVIQAVKQWLSVMTQWLLIFDSANNLDILPDFLPASCPGHVLITTQSRIVGTLAQSIEVDAMTVDEGAYLLLRRAKIINLYTPLDEVDEVSLEQARTLSRLLGGVPLALDQAGAYIEETECGLAHYLNIYQLRHKEFLQQRGSASVDHPLSVATTWSLSFEQVRQVSPTAVALLQLLAFATPDAIPEECITRAVPVLGPELVAIDNPLQFDSAIKVLRQFSLLRRHAETNSLSIHALVQTVLRDSMDEATQRLWAERWVRALALIFPSGDYGTYQQCERLLAQGLLCAEMIQSWHMTFLEAAQLLQRVASYQKYRKNMPQALALYQQEYALLMEILPLNHKEIAFCLREMGDLFLYQGQRKRAEELFEQVVTICEEQFGPDHLEVAHSFHDLAASCILQGKFSQGIVYGQRALRICKLQDTTPSLEAEILNDMAYVFLQQKQYTEAETLYRQALHIHERMLEPSHPNLAIHYNNIAFCLYEQGDYVVAETLYRQALSIWEQAHGPQHPDVAHGLSNLARLYAAQEDYAQAEQYYQQAATILHTVLGPEHPTRIRPLRGLAKLHLLQKQYMQSEQYYQQILVIFEKVPDMQLSTVAEVLNEMIQLYSEQDNSQKVELLQQRVQIITSQMETLQKLAP